ncbi:MAG: hypothetical protein WB661_12300 [Candidatus Bathyarchaeia archaeon]
MLTLPKFSLKQKIWVGIGTVITGILLFFGEKIGEKIMSTASSPPIIIPGGFTLADVFAIGLVIVGIIVVIYGVHATRKQHSGLLPKGASVEGRPNSQQGFDLCRTKDLPQVDELLDHALVGSTVWVMGIELPYWLVQNPNKVRDAVQIRQLSFIFLIAKDSEELERAATLGLLTPGTKSGHLRAIRAFEKLKADLKEDGNKIRLGIYDMPIVHTMVVINPIRGPEEMQIRHYLYNVDPQELPILLAKRSGLTRKQEIVFDNYHRSIEHVLRNTKDLDGNPLLV